MFAIATRAPRQVDKQSKQTTHENPYKHTISPSTWIINAPDVHRSHFDYTGIDRPVLFRSLYF